jgi:hypothetical protein
MVELSIRTQRAMYVYIHLFPEIQNSGRKHITIELLLKGFSNERRMIFNSLLSEHVPKSGISSTPF